jgi:hypothetical protein
MDHHLREAWTRIVLADDLDAHMAAVGQAQANAALVETMITTGNAPQRRTVLFAGAGTGQMFDYVNGSFLAPYRVTFTDINAPFLDRLRERLAGSRLEYETIVDDIEDSTLSGPFGMAVVVLVLEHVEWRKALHSLVGLQPERIHLIVQRNPPDLGDAITPGRALPPSIARASERAHPTLVDPEAIGVFLGSRGYEPFGRFERPVPDEKTMIGLTFSLRHAE